MAEMMNDIAHLSQEIGPRPAGTEEEQQAALYIADELQKSAGFSTVVEDVSCASNGNTVRLICFALSFVCALLALIFPVLSIPYIIVGLLVAALFVLEALGKPVLSRFLRNGVSQNVVAKYNPTSITNTNNRRKIILVTHYDSARVASEYQGIVGRYLPIIRLVSAGALLLAPIILLIKAVFFASEAGGFTIVLMVLQIICLVLMALPLISIIKTRFSSYNEAANNDAAGVAVLLDVARTVGNGLVSNEGMQARARENGVEVHGEEAAYEAGVIPEGVEVSYQTREHQMSPEESLAAAKAAIAALTGKPVADKVPLSDISSKLVRHGEFKDTEEEAAAAAVRFTVEEEDDPRLYNPSGQGAPAVSRESTLENQQSETPDEQSGTEASESFMRESVEALQPGATGMGSSYQKQVPAWARAAQEKAHANKPDLAKAAAVARSRFADAPAAHMADAALHRGSNAAPTYETTPDQTANTESTPAQEAPSFQEPESELSRRLAALREEIDDAAAPSLKKTERPLQDEEVEVDAVVSVVSEPNLDESVVEETFDEELDNGPVIVSMVEPERQSTSEMIEQQQTKKPAAKRKAAARRAATQKNSIGGFLGHASNMVSNVSSKVSGRRGNHAQGAHRDEESDQDNIVLVDEAMVDDLDGRTVSMPQIDVSQFSDDTSVDFDNSPQAVVKDVDREFVAEEYVAEEEFATEPVSPIMGMEAMTTVMPAVQQEAFAAEEEEQPDRHVIVLPDVIAPVAGNMESAKQRAPMASDPDQTQPQAALLSNMLPQIDGGQSTNQIPVQPSENRTVVNPIGLDLPDFNTSDFDRVVVPPIQPSSAATVSFEEETFVQPMGAAGNTGSFAAVSSELTEEAADQGDFIEDADDSVFDEGFTQTGAFAGPDYVEMPRSRVGRIFGRFGKKKKVEEEQTIREWVDVDSDYEARSVGKERGSWESFRNDDDLDAEFIDVDYETVQDDSSNDRTWNGGAFSLQSLRNRVTGAPHDQDPEELDEFAEEPVAAQRGSLKRSVLQEVKITEAINNEMRLLRDFRHPDIDTEVWFVALGAEEALNSGMKAFIEEHRDELKGAMIVNLEGLGAGQFSFIDEEGQYRPNKVSSRLKRVLRQASQKSGVSFATNKLLSRDTAAHVAAQNGFQAMTLAGMDGNQTAYYGSIEDQLDNIQPKLLEQNSRFVLELLKSG